MKHFSRSFFFPLIIPKEMSTVLIEFPHQDLRHKNGLK